VGLKHPGEAEGASPDNQVSHWPDGGQPRPSVVSVWHRQGRDIGA
jgi:secreted PhoX family phosphatase